MTAYPDTVLLPHHFYFSHDIFQREQALFFTQGEEFWGHACLVRSPDDYFVLQHTRGAKVAVNHNGSISIFSNICKHRYAPMLQGSGQVSKIRCPVHFWTYDKGTGNLSHAPSMPCAHYERHKLERESTELYDGFIVPARATGTPLAQALHQAKAFTSLCYDQLTLVRTETYELDANWKDYLDTYLDNYHLDAWHPSFRGFVDSRQIQNVFATNYQINAIGGKERASSRLTETIARYLTARDALPALPNLEHPVVWLCVYPNIIIEIYHPFLILSVVKPLDPETTQIYEHHFCEEACASHAELQAAFAQFMSEVEQEDHQLTARIREGRRVLHQHSVETRGPYSPQERGQRHFHRYLLDRIESSPQGAPA